MGKVKFGVIGANPELRANMVFFHYPHDCAELSALCDSDPEMLEKFRKQYPDQNPKTYSNYQELIKDPEIQAVFIMVRDCFHEEMAVAALEAGKHVYLEKPMAITVDGCDRILEAAMKNGARLMVGHNMRYMPAVVKMKEIIDSGVIGEIRCVWVRHFVNYGSTYFRHWCAKQENCTGLLLQKGAHDIDVIHWLAGGYSKRVVGMGGLSVYNRTTDRLKNGEAPDRKASWRDDCWPPLEVTKLAPEIDIEDHNMLLMQLDNGVQASYEECFFTPDGTRNYTFIGTKGRLENFGIVGDCRICVWTKRRPGISEADLTYRLYDDSAASGGHGGADPKIIKAFFDYIQNGKKPSVSPVAARNAVAAGFLGHRSMRNGNIPFDIPPLKKEIQEYFNGNTSE